jgi:hypothetical protein
MNDPPLPRTRAFAFTRKIISDLKLLGFTPIFTFISSSLMQREKLRAYERGKYDLKDIDAMMIKAGGFDYILYNSQGFFSRVPNGSRSQPPGTVTPAGMHGSSGGIEDLLMFTTDDQWVGRNLSGKYHPMSLKGIPEIPDYQKYNVRDLWKAYTEREREETVNVIGDMDI